MSVYKPKGSRFFVYDFRYNRVRFSGSTRKTTRAAAERVENRVRDRLEEQAERPTKRKPMSLNEAAGRYFEEVAQHQNSADTADYQLANLIRLLGKETLLAEVTDSDIAQYVARRRGERSRRTPKEAKDPVLVSPTSVNREVELLRRVYRRADRTWKVAVGELPNWSDHLLPEPAERVRELRDGEEDELFAALREDFHALILFCLMTGVRLSNAIKLTWKQVDYHSMTITFRVKSRKPGGDIHTIPITRPLLVLLAEQKGNHSTYVFTYVCKRSRGHRKKGERYPFTQSGWRRDWRKALAAAGIEDFRFHDTRHTAATRTLRSSNNLKVVQKMLGHSDIATTARYAHAQLEDVRAAMEIAQSRRNPMVSEEPDAKILEQKAES